MRTQPRQIQPRNLGPLKITSITLLIGIATEIAVIRIAVILDRERFGFEIASAPGI